MSFMLICLHVSVAWLYCAVPGSHPGPGGCGTSVDPRGMQCRSAWHSGKWPVVVSVCSKHQTWNYFSASNFCLVSIWLICSWSHRCIGWKQACYCIRTVKVNVFLVTLILPFDLYGILWDTEIISWVNATINQYTV